MVLGCDEADNPRTKNVLAKTKKECIEKLEALKNSCQVVRPVQVRSDMPVRDWLNQLAQAELQQFSGA